MRPAFRKYRTLKGPSISHRFQTTSHVMASKLLNSSRITLRPPRDFQNIEPFIVRARDLVEGSGTHPGLSPDSAAPGRG